MEEVCLLLVLDRASTTGRDEAEGRVVTKLTINCRGFPRRCSYCN